MQKQVDGGKPKELINFLRKSGTSESTRVKIICWLMDTENLEASAAAVLRAIKNCKTDPEFLETAKTTLGIA